MIAREYSSHDGREFWVCGATSSGDVLVGRVGEADRGGFVVVTLRAGRPADAEGGE